MRIDWVMMLCSVDQVNEQRTCMRGGKIQDLTKGIMLLVTRGRKSICGPPTESRIVQKPLSLLTVDIFWFCYFLHRFNTRIKQSNKIDGEATPEPLCLEGQDVVFVS